MPYSAAYVGKAPNRSENKYRKPRKKRASGENYSSEWVDLDSEYVTANEDFDDTVPAFSTDPIATVRARGANADCKDRRDARKIEALARRLEQPDDWIFENGHWVPTYPFMFDGADLVPMIISRLPGFVSASIVLRISVRPPSTADNPRPDSYTSEFGGNSNEERGSPTNRIIDVERVNDNHYYPVVRGKIEDQGGHGKCLFYSVWHALDQTTDRETRNIIYRGRIPNNKEEGAAYLREQVIAYLRENPAEFADFLIDEAEENEIPSDVGATCTSTAELTRDADEEWPDLLDESFICDSDALNSIIPPVVENLYVVAQKIPFALKEISKAAAQFVGESLSRRAIPSATIAYLPHLRNYLPIATMPPLAMSLYRTADTRKRVRMLLLIAATILPVFNPALTPYAAITRLLSTLHALIADDNNWRDRGLTALLATIHALHLPIASQYVGELLASLDNNLGFLAHIRWVFELEERLMTDDPCTAAALLSSAACYQLLLADKMTKSANGEKKKLAYFVDYLTSLSRLRVEMENFVASEAGPVYQGFNNFVCRNLFSENRHDNVFFAGLRLPLSNEEVADFCTQMQQYEVDTNAAHGTGLLAYTLSRCDDLYSKRGIDKQLWSRDSWIPADTLDLMTTCEAVRLYAAELNSRDEAVWEAFSAEPPPASPYLSWLDDWVTEPAENDVCATRSGGASTPVEAVNFAAFPNNAFVGHIDAAISDAAYGSNLPLPDEEAQIHAFQPEPAATSPATANSPLLAVTAAAGIGAAGLLQGPDGLAAAGRDALAGMAGTLAFKRTGIAVAVGVPLALTIWAVIKARAGWLSAHSNRPDSAEDLSRLAPHSLVQTGSHDNTYHKWIYNFWLKMEWLGEFITSNFDNGLFEKTMIDLWLRKKSTNSSHESTIYFNAAKAAFADYQTDKNNTDARRLSSEDRYGAELYQLANSTVSQGSSPKAYSVIPILVKIKTYETCRWRDLFGHPAEGSISSAVELESLFSLPVTPREARASEVELQKFIRSELRPGMFFELDENCRKGCETALNIYKDSLQTEMAKRNGNLNAADISTSSIYTSNIISSTANECQNFLYNYRGPTYGSACDKKRAELLQCRYAAMYLSILVKRSQEYLDILTDLKTRLPDAYRADTNVLLLDSRAFAVREALRKFSTEESRPNLEQLSAKELLNNYPALIASNEEIFYFVSFAEAIFMRVKMGSTVEQLYREVADPSRVVRHFNSLMQQLPFTQRAHRNGIAGLSYLQSVESNTETKSDTEYYNQFSVFKNEYLSDVAKLIAIDKLTQFGVHPYDIVASRVIRCARMELTLYIPRAVELHGSLPVLSTMIHAGDLAFCQLESSDWIIISTIGGQLFLKTISDSTMCSNAALCKIRTSSTPPPITAHCDYPGEEDKWHGERLSSLILTPIFGTKNPLDKISYETAFLGFSTAESLVERPDGTGASLLQVVQQVAGSLVKDAAEQSEAAHYKRRWWQYFTPMIPGFDIAYRRYHDVEYAPSYGDITWEVINAGMAIAFFGVPIGEILYAESNLLRSTILLNAHKGFRGLALVTRVIEQAGSDLALASLRASTMTVSYFISPWEPVPLELIGTALYKGGRRLMRGKLLFKPRPANVVIGKAEGAPSPGAKSKNPESPEKQAPEVKPLPQIFRTESMRDVKVYEFSYTETSETLLGADNEPQPGPSGTGEQPGDANGFTWKGDFRALEDRGAISLDATRHTVKINTPFQFARNDNQFLSLDPVQSTHPVPQSGFELFQLGQVDDIIFSSFGGKVSFISGSSSSNENVEVLMIPAAEEGAIGVRLNFEDIDKDRPLLVSPGALSDSIFMMGVSKQEGCVLFYHISKPSVDSVASARRDSTIERLLEVHNSLMTSQSMRMALPEDVAMGDIQLLARLFDYANIVYSDPSGATGFDVVAPGSPISRKSAIKNLSRHAVSTEDLWILNYGLLDGNVKFSKLESHTHYLLSRTPADQLNIRGRSEIEGIFYEKIEAKTLDNALQTDSESAVLEIVHLLIQKASYNKFARSPEEFEISHLPGLAEIFSEAGYTTNFRLMKIWSSANRPDSQFHFLLTVQKNNLKYSVDISSARLLNQWIESPIIESDENWRQTYQKYLGDKLCVFQDFSTFNLFEDRFRAGLGSATPFDDANDSSWTVINRPAWMLSRSNHMLVDAMDTDRTVEISSEVLDPSPTAPVNKNPEAVATRWFAQRWLDVIQDDEFNAAIAGAGDIRAIENIEKITKSHGIRTKIYLTLTYFKITDDLPTVNLAVAVHHNNKIVSIIDPSARRKGKGTALFSWDEWIGHRSRGILLGKKYGSASMVGELSDPQENKYSFGSADFFDESNQPYEILSFDSSYLRELDTLIGNVETEMQEMGIDNPDRDFSLEREKLERLRNTVDKDDSDAILTIRTELIGQEQIVKDISKYVALRGLLGRLTDLKGRVSRLRSERPICRGLVYSCNSMLGNKVDLVARMSITYPFIQERLKIRTYDSDKQRYAPSSRFELVLLGNIEYLIKIEDVRTILKHYQRLYDEMAYLATDYANGGGGLRALDVAENARAGSTVVDELLQYYSSSATRIFGIVDKAEKGKSSATVFGLSAIHDESTADVYTVAVSGIIAHPFSQIRNDEKFIGYVFRHRHSPSWSMAELQKYNLEGIGRFLSYHTVKYAVFHMSGVQKIAALAINPRSETIATSFGMRRVDELARYRAVFSRATFNNLRSVLNSAIRRTVVRAPEVPQSGSVPGVVSPPVTENAELKKLLSGNISAAIGKGAIFPEPNRTVRSLPWKFVFARSDSQITHESPQPSTALGTTSPYDIQLGQGSDIVSYSQSSRVSYGDFWSGENDELQKLDVILVPNGNDGANGIKISLDELIPGRPLLISSGALSGCTQIICIKKSENSIYIYHAGKHSPDTQWQTHADGVKHIAHVHGVLTGQKSSLVLPDEPTSADLTGLYGYFDNTYIISSRPLESTSPTRIERQDSTHWAYSYKGDEGRFSVGNSQLLILKDSKGDVQVEGFVEVGSLGQTSVKKVKVTAANDIERYFPPSAARPSVETSRTIAELRTKLESDDKLRPFFNDPRTAEAAAAKEVMSFMNGLGRAVKCRLVMIWRLPNTIEPEMHYLIIDDTGDTAVAVDITAGRYPVMGLPFYGTEEAWARKFRDVYPRSFVAYKDFDSVADIDTVFSGAISDSNSAVGSMTPLRVPQWRLRKVDYPMYPYTSQDTTTFSATVHLGQKGDAYADEMGLNPEWSVDTDTKGLYFGRAEDIFKGVYEKRMPFRQKDYYIRSDGHTYQVVLDSSGRGWNLKPGRGTEPTTGTIAVERKVDGRWVVRKTASETKPVPSRGDAYPGKTAFRKLAEDLSDINVDRTLWNGDYAKRIVDRDTAEIRKNIDIEVKEMGGLETYIDLVGINPYAPKEPPGDLSANNIFKLMVEDVSAVDPTRIQQTDFSEFATTLNTLDHQKNYVFLIMDHRLGHNYLIDIPAGPELMAYSLQSNVEPGVIPEVGIRDWLRGRGMESVSIEDILALMRPGFAQSPPTEQARLLASIFDRERNPANIDVSRLRTDKGVTFIMQSYDRANFERNVERVRGVKDLKS